MTTRYPARSLVRRSLIGVAVLAATAGAAQAQNVTLFGRLDVGFQFTNKVNPAGDSLSELKNGGILPSIWGMRGSEDLGNGLKAVFNLESDFGGDTGGSRGLGSISSAFGRQANVGLSGGFGTVLLGRQYSPAIIAELGTDPRGYKESYSMLLPYALTQAPAGNDVGPNNGLGIFTSNLVSYSNSFGPVNLGVAYGFGEVAGDNSAGRTISLGLSYSGPVVVSFSYQTIRGLGVGADDETKRLGVGLAVPLGDFTIKGLFAKAEYESPGVPTDKVDNFGVGADWRWSPANSATLALYQGKNKGIADGTTRSIVLSNDHSLSKRTVLYGQFVHVDRDINAGAETSIAAGGTPAGQKASIINVGIKHDF
ncbi:porin [uncultured Methylibium sp.]|uniref:porin n=1 Tax=uncultured Methylibium sp. TaxID=381093 RepID=UPI0025F6267A|nr:porin [uncultured Methylibium sp.]